MNSDRWQRIESLFAEANEMDEASLERFLEEKCIGDEALKRSLILLIEQDREIGQSSFLERMDIPATAEDHAQVGLVGTWIGPFEIKRLIGSGGMGDVYLGVRTDDYQQQAAIKLIRSASNSQDVLRRFRNEMQFLASLGKHPSITSILDAGTTKDGQPYIAMEFVDGLKITEYCDQQRMSVRERLRIFRRACDAVQFAHQNAVLHRDLKPGNLLVTADGQPMLIDFGVAKLTESHSEMHQTQTVGYAFTPDYASPEQYRGELLTTASDVFSLGVILYELLVGHRPFGTAGGSLAEIVRKVCDTDPAKPSVATTHVEKVWKRDGKVVSVTPESTGELRGLTPRRLNLAIRGDLDRIIMKAIEKDISQRYQTVDQLINEIERYLNGQPVEARGNGLVYRVNKYVRRNKIAVATAVGFVLMLLTGIAATSRSAVVASRAANAEREQRILAEKRERTANEVLEVFDDFISSTDPRKTGNPDYLARDMLHEFGKKLSSTSVDDPVVQARLLQSTASALEATGEYGTAIKRLREARLLFQDNLGPRHNSTLAVELRLGQLLLMNYVEGSAERTLKHFIAMSDQVDEKVPKWDLGQFNALVGLAEAECMLGKLDAAEITLGKAKSKISSINESYRSEAEFAVSRCRTRLLMLRGKLRETLPFAEEEYEIAKSRYGETDYRTVMAADLFAKVQMRQERFGEAVVLFEIVLRTARRTLGNQHRRTLTHIVNLANAKYAAEQFVDAENLFREYESLCNVHRIYAGPYHHNLLRNWADCLGEIGEFELAEELLQDCYEFSSCSMYDEDCQPIRDLQVKIFRLAGREEMAAKWQVRPGRPKCMPSSDVLVESSGKATLVASSFAHPAKEMQHYATRWQIRAAHETFEYSPTFDVTTTEQLQQITLPAGILLPNQKYFWRVAFVGQNQIESDLAKETELSTRDLEYRFHPFDLAKYFNRDVVYSPGDESEDAFFSKSHQLVIDGHEQSDQAHGVPKNRLIGPHRLGDYQELNAIQCSNKTKSIRVDLPPTKTQALRFLLASTLNSYVPRGVAIRVTLQYADGAHEPCMVNCPDVSEKFEYRTDDGVVPANIVRNGMSRVSYTGTIKSANLALFDTMIAVDSSRELVAIEIIRPTPESSKAARFNILAISGVLPRD